MTLSALPGLARLTFHFTAFTVWEMTQVCRQATGIAHTDAGLQGLADAVDAAMVAAIAPLIATGSTYDGVTAHDLSTQGLGPKTNTSAVTGTGGATELPVDTALVTTTYTGKGGRDSRGRWYWGALPSTVLSDGGATFTTAAGTARASLVASVFSAIASATPVNYVPGLHHRNATAHFAADTFTPLLTATGRTTLASVRSRRFRP